MVLVLAILLVSSACNKSTEEVAPVDDIIGTWTAITVSTKISYNDLSAYDYLIGQGFTNEEANLQVNYQTSGFESYIPFSLTFKENGTYSLLSGSIGDKTGDSSEGTWVLSEDKTTLTIDTIDEIKIITLTTTELAFQLLFESDDYSPELMTYEITLTYEK